MTRLRHIACLALGLGLAGLTATEASAQMTVRDDAIGYALENLVSGTPATLSLGEAEVTVTPLRTWKSVSGHWCRRYELAVAEPGAEPARDQATRCRQDGIWKPVAEE